MAELIPIEPATEPVEDAIARRLELATAAMAARLADLLDRVSQEGRAPVPGAIAFLRAMSSAPTAEGSAAPGPPAPAHPLDRLATGIGLTQLELDLIVLAGMPEQHEGYASVMRSLDPDGGAFPTLGLAAELLGGGGPLRGRLRELVEHGAAVARGVLTIAPERAFFERPMRLPHGLWSALHGLEAWRADLHPEAPPGQLAGFEEWLASAPAQRAFKALFGGLEATVLVTAESEDVAHVRGAALASHAGVRAAYLRSKGPLERSTESLIDIHATAHGAVPVLRLDLDDDSSAAVLPLQLHPGPVVICARPGSVRAAGVRPLIPVPAERIGATAARAMWRSAVPELGGDCDALARLHRVEPGLAAAAASDVRAVEGLDSRPARFEDVTDSLRARLGVASRSGVAHVRPSASFDDLVLPPERLAQLHEALDRLLHQGTVLDEWGFLDGRPGARGVKMLFAGPPGTGKTLSAEVMANALGVDMLVVDLSRTVSKWIGETEKNLAQAFEAAEGSHALLLFDEADALFGKRTDVADAHDRYANLETAYLLARLERFEGIAILATNLRRNIDTAFTRRLEFVLSFEEPGPEEREALWRCHLPPGAPLADDVDTALLAARYPVVGAVIRNAATAAAFLAAAEDEPIGYAHLIRALRREYEKSGRAFTGPPTTHAYA